MPKGRQIRQLQAEIVFFCEASVEKYRGPAAIAYVIWHPIQLEWGGEFSKAPIGCTKQITCATRKCPDSVASGSRSSRTETPHFLGKREIHGELGSVHAMNFGRNPKYLEVRSDSEAASATGHQDTSINNARIGPES